MATIAGLIGLYGLTSNQESKAKSSSRKYIDLTQFTSTKTQKADYFS